MPLTKNATGLQIESNSEPTPTAAPPTLTVSADDAKEKATQSAAKFSVEINAAVAEQTAKAFEEQADFCERIGRSASGHAIDRIVAGITAGLESVIRDHVSQQLPALVAHQADSLREVARALRSSAS